MAVRVVYIGRVSNIIVGVKLIACILYRIFEKIYANPYFRYISLQKFDN